MQEKEIIITNLSTRLVTPKPGATWKAFNVYQIMGNDGVTYQTTDRDYYQALQLGQTIKIKFTTETKTSNGKVYTSYKLVLPKRSDPAIAEMEKKIMDKLDLMEKNLVSFIRMNQPKAAPAKEPEVDPKQLSLFPDDDEGPEENPDLEY